MDKPVVEIIFSLLGQFGVNKIVCSPGSRNAALIAEADRREENDKFVVVDERSAGFIGLGLALVSREPVALVCTSGSALLNYGPSIAEAFYQGIPLIVLSADRPAEWIDQDDSQTIVQPGALSNIIKRGYDLDGSRDDNDYLWYVNRVVNEGLQEALRPKQGPVHFNIHLDGHVHDRYGSLENRHERKIDFLVPPSKIEKIMIENLAQKSAFKKIMITAGFMPPDNKLQKSMQLLASLPNVCVMAETVSNLHLNREAYMIDNVLFQLSEDDEERLKPDLVISIGGALISRKLKEFIRRVEPKEHWSVGHSDNVVDCFKVLTLKIESVPAAFLQTFGKLIKRFQKQTSAQFIPCFKEQWGEARKQSTKNFHDVPWSDLKALGTVLNRLPSDVNLFLSNGTSVRYAQIISHIIPHAVYSNRGVSGIEGSTSTAIGGMLAYDKMTCLITGDTSFGYDIGALGCDFADARMRVILLDNGGGDIFRFINATRHLKIREEYLCADMNVPAASLASAYDWDYYKASSEKELIEALKRFFKDGGKPSLLHIDTSQSGENADILRKFLNKRHNELD